MCYITHMPTKSQQSAVKQGWITQKQYKAFANSPKMLDGIIRRNKAKGVKPKKR